MRTLGELLSEIKQYEVKFTTLLAKKNRIVSRRMSVKEDTPKSVIEEFHANKKSDFESVEKEIQSVQDTLIDLKTKVNKINIENGLDRKLLELKYTRIRLAEEMKLVKGGYLSQPELGELEPVIEENISVFEKRKLKIDGDVQRFNFTFDAS